MHWKRMNKDYSDNDHEILSIILILRLAEHCDSGIFALEVLELSSIPGAIA